MQKFYLYRNAWRFDGAPHEESRLQKTEWKSLLKQGGLLVRNTYDFDCKENTCFWYIIKDHYEGIEGLSSRTRNKIRHAFSHFDYRTVTFETMIEDAYPIVEETFSGYSVRDRKMDKSVFQAYLNQCKEKSFDYWGVFDKETQEMVGFCTVAVWENCCEYGMTGILTKYKKDGYYPYYGLYHNLNMYYLDKQGFKYVSDSARTITEHSQIHEFLINNFNFRRAYCKLDVHYRWWVKMAVNVLYPFRNVITLPHVKAVLNMEAMRRGEK